VRTMDLDVFLHTNTETWQRPDPGNGFTVRAGWATDDYWNASELRKAFDCCVRAPWSVNACFKYDWLLSLWRRRGDRVALLADTDVLFQCTATELRERFETRFGGAPLVIGGEHRRFPRPHNARHDPFGPDPRLPFKVRYARSREQLLYPNSGLVMGTAAGFESLSAALHRLPHFPCCAFEGEIGGFDLAPCNSCQPPRIFPKPVPCTVEDQACLQVALASSRPPAHVVDVNATLFLHLGSLRPFDVQLRRDGRLAFRRTGEVPCVIHANGYKGVLSLLGPRLQGIAWSVQRSRRIADVARTADAPAGWVQWERRLPPLRYTAERKRRTPMAKR